jgi:hypothetical protein
MEIEHVNVSKEKFSRIFVILRLINTELHDIYLGWLKMNEIHMQEIYPDMQELVCGCVYFYEKDNKKNS